ncbi:putative Carboxylesterase [Candidatus Zixiibacteriota bacterium]|nr:putative Carboxylesterase [candidate division Zixibacteria bacterium]
MPIYQHRHLNLYYETFGQGPVALLFIHGLGGDGRTWKYQIDHFAPNYEIVTVDLFGHGRSSRDLDPEMAPRTDAEAIDALARNIIRKPYVAVGHSFASQILPEIIKLAYFNLRAAVFVDCTYQGFPEIIEARMEFARSMLALDDAQLKIETEKWYRNLMLDIKTPDDESLIFPSLLNCDYRWLFRSVGGCREFNRLYPPQDTPDILPVFVMEADNGIGADFQKSWVNHFKSAEYYLFENAYHFFFVSQQQKFSQLLSEFLEKCRLTP